MSGALTTRVFEEIMRAAGYEVRSAANDQDIVDGVADSRRAQAGTLFAAFRGEQEDGNAYLEDALERGATAIVAERPPTGTWPNASVVVVNDTRKAMAALAREWRDRCNPRVVGITGTVGKTTAKELTAAALSRRFTTHRSKENFNSREGLPIALLSLREEHEVSVLEIAMDSPGEIRELCDIARPDVGIVLNIGLTHVSKLGTVDAIAAEKMSLATWLPANAIAVLNMDDTRIRDRSTEVHARILGFGRDPACAIQVRDVTERGLEGCDIDIRYEGRDLILRSPLPGAHVAPAAIVAFAANLALGIGADEGAANVAAADAPGRMRILRSQRGATIIDDRYNSSPASLEGALRMLATMAGRRIALLGPMAELGDFESAEHERLGRVAAATLNRLAATGPACKGLVDSAQAAGLRDATWYETKEDAAQALAADLRDGDTVLVKASRSMALETILPVLEGER